MSSTFPILQNNIIIHKNSQKSPVGKEFFSGVFNYLNFSKLLKHNFIEILYLQTSRLIEMIGAPIESTWAIVIKELIQE